MLWLLFLAQADWQPLIDAVSKTVLSVDGLINPAILVMLGRLYWKQRANDQMTREAKDNSKVAANASLATAAATGVPPKALTDETAKAMKPMTDQINGNGLASRMDALEVQVARFCVVAAQIGEFMSRQNARDNRAANPPGTPP